MKLLKTTALTLALGVSLIHLPASAHARWILPSHVSLSGEKAHNIVLDLSISNELFKADKPLSSKQSKKGRKSKFPPASLSLTHPDGSIDQDLPFSSFTRKSVANIELADTGTYRASVLQPGIIFTFYKKADGSRGRAFGPKNKVKLPKGATITKSMSMTPVAETYITRNNQSVVNVSGKGLEWQFITHPSELFASEPAKMKLLIDGKPAKDAKVEVTKSGTRYRNDRTTQSVTTDSNGELEIKWQGAGMYLIEAGFEVPVETKNIDSKYYALFTTLEVNPD